MITRRTINQTSISEISTITNEADNFENIQRIYKYNHNLKDLLDYWLNRRDDLEKRKNAENKKSDTADQDNKQKDNQLKKINKKEAGVKYDYKNPDANIKKIIPFCNNIFTISKNDQ